MQPDQFLQLASELKQRADSARLFRYFPEVDTVHNGVTYHSRDKYPRHMEFFARGKDTFARMFAAAVGAGKTEALLQELTFHGRGWYPDFWPGLTYDRPLDIWVCGKTIRSVRDILQTKWLGPPNEEHFGNGILPLEWLDLDSIARLSQGSVDSFRIRHVSGGYTHVGFKAYEQGVGSFYGTDKDIVAYDEPCPLAIYSQGLMRTRNRHNARVLYTVAALEGKTETVKMFMDEPDPSRVMVTCSWDDVPHLTEEWKRNTLANTAEYLRDSVRTGLPSRSQGAVYPVKEESFVIDPIPIPKHWKWVAGFDGGYHNTAGTWVAYDEDADVAYLAADYKDGGPGTNLELHAMRLLARSKGFGFQRMPFRGDAAAINQDDGQSLRKQYRDAGLNLELADKAVTAGIAAVLNRLETGRLKVFRTCVKWLDEFRAYRYEYDEETGEHGKIIKVNDHLMDATRYAIMSLKHAKQAASSAPVRILTPGVRR